MIPNPIVKPQQPVQPDHRNSWSLSKGSAEVSWPRNLPAIDADALAEWLELLVKQLRRHADRQKPVSVATTHPSGGPISAVWTKPEQQAWDAASDEALAVAEDDGHYPAFVAAVGAVRHKAEPFLKQFFGERCPDFEADCEACKRWAALETLLDNPFEPGE